MEVPNTHAHTYEDTRTHTTKKIKQKKVERVQKKMDRKNKKQKN